jgi:hypothetical protein
MALLSFVESAPRAYRLKASNAAPPFSTSAGTSADPDCDPSGPIRIICIFTREASILTICGHTSPAMAAQLSRSLSQHQSGADQLKTAPLFGS